MWKKWSIVSTFQIHCCDSDCPVRTWSSSQLYPVHFSSSPCLILKNERPSSPSSLDLQPFICFCCVWGFRCLVSLVWTPLIFLFGGFYTEDRLPSRYSQELFDAFILSFRLRLAEYVNKEYMLVLCCVWLKVSICCRTTEQRGEENPFFNRLFSFHPSLSSLHFKRISPKGPIRTAK